MAGNPPGQPTPPSTWITGAGTLLTGSAVVTFAADVGLSTRATGAIAGFGLLLVAVGSWLHQIGH